MRITEVISRSMFHIMVICPVAILFIPHSAGSQETAADSIRQMEDLLEEKKVQTERMHRMLDALNHIDSVYKVQYPTWVVVDEDMRERIRRAFRTRGTDIPRDAEIVVVANETTGEIIEISAGEKRMGRIEAYTFLSDSLYDKILAGDYARIVFDPKPERKVYGQLYGIQPEFAAVYTSAFGAGMLFSNGWGAEAKLGFEELGYHFWSTGSLRALAVFDQLKIGVVMPIANGAKKNDNHQPLDVRPRKMTGALGFSSEFVAPFGKESAQALLSVADLPRVTNDRLLSDSTDFYFLHTVAQLSYSRTFDIFKGETITLTGGLGYHQMAHATLLPDASVLTNDKEDFISPILRLEYINHVSNMYGVSAQIYSGIAYFKGWVELMPNLLFLDLQYYTPIFRDPKPWEQPYFFMISPRIQVIY